MAESRELLASILASLLNTMLTPPTCFCNPDVDGRVQGTAGQHLGISTQRYNHPTHLFPYSRCGWQSPGNCWPAIWRLYSALQSPHPPVSVFQMWMAESREQLGIILASLLSTTITQPTCFRIPDVDGRVQGSASKHLGVSTQHYNHPTHLFPYSRCGWQSPGNC
jgi:hypothetical protein